MVPNTNHRKIYIIIQLSVVPQYGIVGPLLCVLINFSYYYKYEWVSWMSRVSEVAGYKPLPPRSLWYLLELPATQSTFRLSKFSLSLRISTPSERMVDVSWCSSKVEFPATPSTLCSRQLTLTLWFVSALTD